MSDRLEFQVDTRTLVAAKQALDTVAGASRTAEQAAKLYRDAQGRLRQENGRFATEAQKVAAGLQEQARAIRQTDDVMKRLKQTVQGYLTLATARRLLEMADAFAQIGARLRVVSDSATAASAAQRQLVDLAIQTRTPLESVARTYQRIAAVSAELGVSQGRVLRVTQAISQSFQVSGATASEAAASAQQLAQALGSGRLNGDELRSVLENNLTLAQSIAAGFGVSVGQLRAMGEAGQLTSREVFAAIERQAGNIASQFREIGPSLSGGVATFNTGLQAAVGRIDTMVGLTRTLGSLLDGIGRSLASDAFADALFPLVQSLKVAGAIVTGQGGLAIRSARDLALGRAELESRERMAAQRAQDAMRARGAAVANPLFTGSGTLATTGQLGLAGLGSGLSTLQSIGLAVPQGFRVGDAEASDGALAAAFRARDRAARPGQTAAERWIDSQAQARNGSILGGRPAVGSLSSTTFDQVFGGLTAVRARRRVRMELPDSIRRAAAELERPRLEGMDLVRANIQPVVELQERQRRAAEETRRLWSENLSRGIYDGFRQPIADFLTTWKFSARTAGDFLRQALANAVASVIANELTQLAVRLGGVFANGGRGGRGDGIKNGLSMLGNATSLFSSLSAPSSLPVLTAVPGGPVLAGAGTGGAAGGFGSVAPVLSALAPVGVAAGVGLGWGAYVASISGGNRAARDANAAFAQRFRDQQAALAMRRADDQAYLQAVGDGMVIGAPSGYDVAPARGMAVSGNTINITVPEGTSRQQAEAIVRELQGIAMAQTGNPSKWSEVYVS